MLSLGEKPFTNAWKTAEWPQLTGSTTGAWKGRGQSLRRLESKDFPKPPEEGGLVYLFVLPNH